MTISRALAVPSRSNPGVESQRSMWTPKGGVVPTSPGSPGLINTAGVRVPANRPQTAGGESKGKPRVREIYSQEAPMRDWSLLFL